jgi:hypothetical protein
MFMTSRSEQKIALVNFVQFINWIGLDWLECPSNQLTKTCLKDGKMTNKKNAPNQPPDLKENYFGVGRVDLQVHFFNGDVTRSTSLGSCKISINQLQIWNWCEKWKKIK